MLKKVIIGILCLVILAATGGGIYLYTLDWNKHKTVVAQRFSQITGLTAVIEGNLNVEMFPSPKFTASKVKFFKTKGDRSPLVMVNEISAAVELMPLLDNKFILNSMSMTQATVYVNVDQQGSLNWQGVGQNSNTKSGNVEVSFHDIRLTNSTVSYENAAENEKLEISGISANINAPSLKGPYKTDGKFIHNNSEIRFKGNIVKEQDLTLKMTISNASSRSEMTIDGTLGGKAQGNITFDTQSVFDISNVLFGEASISECYDQPLYFSFKYDYDNGLAKLNNFTSKYGAKTAGSGTVIVKSSAEGKEINADFDMAKFDLKILENLAQDIIDFSKSGKKISESNLEKYATTVSIKSGSAWFRDTEAQNLTLGLNFKQGVLDITRFGIVMPGDTIIKTAGRVTFNDTLEYVFNQAVDSKDLRTFASVFNIDLTKLTAPENKKSVFKKAQADLKLSGDLKSLKISIPRATIDSTSLKGNIGFVMQDKDKTLVLADIDASKTIFDKYLQPIPADLKNVSLKNKFIYQMNLIPWNHKLTVDAELRIASAVYNEIPMEKIHLAFTSEEDRLKVKQLSFENIAGASLTLAMDADKVYSEPYFNELSYDVKTDNFPLFVSTLGIDTGTKDLFKRRLFAAQGAMSGTMNEFSLSSIQKFGDTEFSYSGTVTNSPRAGTAVNGSLELKTNNFSGLIKGLNLDYKPDMPVTTFTLAAKLAGTANAFELADLNAYLGANNIKGKLKLDNSTAVPNLTADLSFDKFEADRWFNLNKSTPAPSQKAMVPFISEPALKEQKIDYAPLKKADFDIKASSKQLVFDNNVYTNAQTQAKLKNGILNVTQFDALLDTSNINLHFILDSNNLPKINGYFDLKKFKTPMLGGSVYVLESGWLDAEGTFSSAAASKKDFMDNLNAKGKFILTNTAMQGWDLDIIKFELEQRKTVAGFEENVLKSLKTGRSSFTKVRGSYNINKGLAVADNIIWESPVVNMNMQFNLNLSDWLFSAVFNAIYHNASFSDIFKFTFDGNLANPNAKTDLSESIARISKIEDRIKNARKYEEKEKMERIGSKLKALQREADSALQDINRMSLDVVRFKPVTDNENVVNIYNSNLKTINEADINVRRMVETLKNYPNEEILMNLEAELGAEKAKLKFIPKVLEENYLVDSKYIFDDTFNKIAWLYNLAQNNSSYHTGLTDVYMTQVEVLKSSDTPLSDEQVKPLIQGIEKSKQIMENISALHAKIRDNYLSIIDSVKISEMRENNKISNQALQTMLTYAKQLNDNIIANIDMFRAVLGITARDYDEYMVYPPETADEIDSSKPTIHLERKAETAPTPEPTAADENTQTPIPSPTDESAEAEKKEALAIEPVQLQSGLSERVAKLHAEKAAKKEIVLAETLEFNGLSQIFKSNVKGKTQEIQEIQEHKPDFATAENNLATPLLQKALPTKGIKAATLTAENKDKPVQISVLHDEKAPDETSVTTKANDKVSAPAAMAEVKMASAEITPPANTTPKTTAAKLENAELETNPVQNAMAAKPAEGTKIAEAPLMPQAAKIQEENNILSKTRAAISDIMAKIKSGEKKLETLIAKNDKPAADVPLPPIEINTANLPLPNKDGNAPTASSLKVNPVVALEIGKETTATIEPMLKKDIHKKQGFTVKKAAKNSPDAIANQTIAATTAVTANIELPKTAKKPNDRKNPILLQLFAEESSLTHPEIADNDLTNSALTYAESPVDDAQPNNKNRYLFAATETNPHLLCSGTTGKSMLADRKNAVVAAKKPKYVFAANSLPRNFDGEVGKRKFLAVK